MKLTPRSKITPFVTFAVCTTLLVAAFWLACAVIERLRRRKPCISPSCSGFVPRTDERDAIDWWACPELLTGKERVFNKSIFYVKPHKTGSESFKEILIAISDYYNLTNEMQNEGTMPEEERPKRPSYDVLIRHQRYLEGVTEREIHGWEDGDFEVGKNGEPPKRQLTKVVTIRNPLERLFSHYFSQRRFGNFVPRRGNFTPGTISEQEELNDFIDWLEGYPTNQQVRYLMNTPRQTSVSDENTIMLQRVAKIVNFYDHVIIVDQWKQSLCLFGFIEKIKPQLLQLKINNRNKPHSLRFNVRMALLNTSIYEGVLAKVKYDFVLYQSLFKKYTKKLDEVSSPGMQRYCALVT